MEPAEEKHGVKASSFVFENKGKLKDYYRIGKLIGSGAFGDVRIWLHKESNSQRAVKILYKANMSEDDERMLINEINILRDLDHPNIVKMYEFFQDEKRYYIITDLCKGGELFDEIIERGHFSEKDAAVIVRQLLSWINYCHSRNIVHRDIKPENILLESNKDFDQIKIIDFGISVVKDPNQFIEESIGTPYYIAPEVWKKKYDEKWDVWSCGVILYILLSGTPPFNAASDAEMKTKILEGTFSISGKVWDAISEEAKDLVSQLLTYDKEKRVSANEALSHPWITKMSESEVDVKVAKKALTNLSKFRAEEKIKQATVAYIASQLLTKKEKENLASIFKAFDTNGDGMLSKEEIKEGYEKIFGQSINQEQIEQMFAAVDIDNSGFIDYSEFVVATMSEKNLFSEKKLKAAFKMFDTDDSGYISKSEVKESFMRIMNISESELEEIVSQVDENGDGEISFEEFKVIMTKMGTSQDNSE